MSMGGTIKKCGPRHKIKNRNFYDEECVTKRIELIQSYKKWSKMSNIEKKNIWKIERNITT